MTSLIQNLEFASPERALGHSLMLECPAKINLRLKVLGRRRDQYHLLSMLNSLVNLTDRVLLQFSEQATSVKVSGELSSAQGSELSDVSKNLASRAFLSFCERFSLPLQAQISIEKNIPVAAGLGGGSTNAAGVLRQLARSFGRFVMTQQGLDAAAFSQRVVDIALSLGADVPYLLFGGLAQVTGVGEVIQRYDSRFLEGVPLLLVKPSEGASTASVFAEVRAVALPDKPARDLPCEQYGEMLRLNTSGPDYDPSPSQIVLGSLRRQLWPLIANDLEPHVVRLVPKVGEVLEIFRACPHVHASVTGSGSGVFAVPKKLDFFQTAAGEELLAKFLRPDLNSYRLKFVTERVVLGPAS
jgi:4-diphosphocytidyl-2-C-methyl-D-erythritol kinase